ncbi:MAG: class I SAM-dependent methyltransferase [Bacillota bacterium]
MKDIERQLKQCKKPTGEQGRVTVQEMNENHYKLTSWGLEQIKTAKNSTILDIGCGGGLTVARLAEMALNGKVYGIDYSADCVTWSKQYNEQLIAEDRVEIIHSGVENMPFEDNWFDLVLAVETIYFWPNIVRCFEEVKRVLKPGGRFLIINAVYPSDKFKERNERYLASGEMAMYSPGELKRLLEKAGFSVVALDLIEDKNWQRCLSKA